jgi:hypothetical protein
MPIVFALVALAFLWGNGGSLAAMAQRLWAMLPAMPKMSGNPTLPAPAVDDDTLDFQALKRLQLRAECRRPAKP